MDTLREEVIRVYTVRSSGIGAPTGVLWRDLEGPARHSHPAVSRRVLLADSGETERRGASRDPDPVRRRERYRRAPTGAGAIAFVADVHFRLTAGTGRDKSTSSSA